MLKLSNADYAEMTKKASPNTKSFGNSLRAFVFGGAICLLGQWLKNIYLNVGMDADSAGITVSVTLIFIASLLTGLNVYDKIAVYAGAGTLVPITGFSNAVTAPALDFKTEGYILGLGAKMFIVAGPVIVYGISSGVIYGVFIFLFGLY